MRLAIDTNRYVDMDEGVTEVVKRLEAAEEVWIPVIVLGELVPGFEIGEQKQKNEEQLIEFIDRLSAGILVPDQMTARTYGEVVSALRKQGTPIPTNDIWIAALSIQHDLVLDTRDSHFQKVPNLKLLETAK